MKKVLFATLLLALVIIVPISTIAQVGVSVSIGLPPPVVFQEPPDVIVLPDTDDVYVVPGIDVDLFFWNGWWWRPWEGRWYRSRYYDRGWVNYSYVPTFYFDVDPGWRGYYRERNWYGHPWYYERIDQRRLHRQWQRWHTNRYWERQQTWGVWNYQPRPQHQRQELRSQRQHQYHQRPVVLQHQQQRQPQVQQPRQQSQERIQKPQRQEQRPQVQQLRQQSQERVRQPQGQANRPETQQPQHFRPQGKPERGDGEHRK